MEQIGCRNFFRCGVVWWMDFELLLCCCWPCLLLQRFLPAKRWWWRRWRWRQRQRLYLNIRMEALLQPRRAVQSLASFLESGCVHAQRTTSLTRPRLRGPLTDRTARFATDRSLALPSTYFVARASMAGSGGCSEGQGGGQRSDPAGGIFSCRQGVGEGGGLLALRVIVRR